MTWRGPGEDAGCAKKTELGCRFSGECELLGVYIEVAGCYSLIMRAFDSQFNRGRPTFLVSRLHVTLLWLGSRVASGPHPFDAL